MKTRKMIPSSSRVHVFLCFLIFSADVLRVFSLGSPFWYVIKLDDLAKDIPFCFHFFFFHSIYLEWWSEKNLQKKIGIQRYPTNHILGNVLPYIILWLHGFNLATFNEFLHTSTYLPSSFFVISFFFVGQWFLFDILFQFISASKDSKNVACCVAEPKTILNYRLMRKVEEIPF